MDEWITLAVGFTNLKSNYWSCLPERSSISYSVKDKDFCPHRFFHLSCPCLCFRSRSGLGVNHALCHWSYFVQDVGPHLTSTKVSTCSINLSLIIHNFPEFKNIPHFLIPCPLFYLPTFCNSLFNHPESPVLNFICFRSSPPFYSCSFSFLVCCLCLIPASFSSIWLLFLKCLIIPLLPSFLTNVWSTFPWMYSLFLAHL